MTEITRLRAEIAALRKQAETDDAIIAGFVDMTVSSIDLLRHAVLSDTSPEAAAKTQALVNRWEALVAAIAAGRADALLTNAPTSRLSN